MDRRACRLPDDRGLLSGKTTDQSSVYNLSTNITVVTPLAYLVGLLLMRVANVAVGGWSGDLMREDCWLAGVAMA